MGIPTSITFVKREGKLICTDIYNKTKMEAYLDSLTEGDQIEVTYEIKHKDASYGQLARVHASIRALATESGSSFEEMKREIKRRCGLVNTAEPAEEKDYKSFADCSKEELSKVIQECITVGELLNVNLHG